MNKIVSSIIISFSILLTEGIGTSIYSQTNKLDLSVPYATPSATNFSQVMGWPDEKKPIAPTGFTVSKFADGFHNPRWIYVAPNGDIFVSEAGTRRPKEIPIDEYGKAKSESQNFGSANRIILFRDINKNSKYEGRYTYKTDLDQPFGMLIVNNYFYIANTSGVVRYPYKPNDTILNGNGQQIVDLPADGYNNHWTRNIIANPQNTKIYITVGSASNNGEHGMHNEVRRAAILEVNLDGSEEQIYASGLRNPVPLDWEPVTGNLWTAVNERDGLGDDLVPDYATHVKRGGFYGWPYAYFGANEDPRMKGQRPDLVEKTIVPDIALGAHTASLGLMFYRGNQFPARYHNGMFIGQHGSWNRSILSGYKVLFVPFENGKPSSAPEDFLTGFVIDPRKGEVHGRPVCVAELPDGSLLVSDDAAKVIWRVSVK
ncbi:sorbosone dehydrogenase family protein [Dysgonomonas sp. Marseille-P4677]|uniref:PQQ-dependent sugar dehydrogenase n=1 Tax=Dysgonomonas sp. Marseille-P4677 TaxID=2364790 RepID=UPI0019136F11|nr:sorbosone dehydrogenase family protein [Dysgonomonas sp. Marseille-P4677]MBK5722347.1 sorbosone dehydrogenase family protein [Dysgonomonas sp. Marseille-P4677]